MEDLLDFYKEVMILLSEPVSFSKQLYLDMEYIKEEILAGPHRYDIAHLRLCHCAFRIAKVLKKRLPDSIHNRMVLGTQNEKTQEYIKFCERLKK